MAKSIPDRKMFCNSLNIIFLVLLCIGNSYADASDTDIDPIQLIKIDLENIQSRPLLYLIGRLTNNNIVISSEFKNERIDIAHESIDANELVSMVVNRQGLVMKKNNDTLLIASECRLNNLVNDFGPELYDETISVLYQNVSVGKIIDDINSIVDKSIDSAKINRLAPLTIQMRSKNVRDNLNAIATVEGFSTTKLPDKKIRLSENHKVSRCQNLRNKPYKQIDKPLFAELNSTDDTFICPHQERPCDLLEQYDLEEMTFLGYMQIIPDTDRVAVIEVSGLETFTAWEGYYMGKNRGRIERIDSAGEINITEIVSNNLGGWMERHVSLSRGIKYEEPRSKILRIHLAPINKTLIQNEFILAAKKGNLVKLNNILLEGANIDATYKKDGANAIAYAVGNKYYKITQWLIEKGANINSMTTEFQFTPLHRAARTGSVDMVRMIIDAGADIHLTDVDQNTVLYVAAIEGHNSIVKLLLSHDAKPDVVNNIGVNALTIAAMQGNIDLINIFLNEGYDINFRDRNGYTMLRTSVEMGQISSVKYLVELGADRLLEYEDDKNILDIAISEGHDEIAAYLKTKGLMPRNINN